MAIPITGTFEPLGDFPLVVATDVEMPDGSRLADYKPKVELTEEQIAALKGKDGKDGVNGKDGVDGKNGADGYTPVKGKDYWNDADKQEIMGEVNTHVDSLFVTISQEAYDLLVSNGTVDANKYYMIVGDSE